MAKYYKDPETGIEYKTAAIQLRLLAFIADLFLILLICYPVVRLIKISVDDQLRSTINSNIGIISIILSVFVLYHVFFDLSRNQSTIAKMIFGFYTANRKLYRISFLQSLVRNIFKSLILISPFFFLWSGFIVWIVIYIFANNHKEGISLYDILTGTIVFQKK